MENGDCHQKAIAVVIGEQYSLHKLQCACPHSIEEIRDTEVDFCECSTSHDLKAQPFYFIIHS